MPKISTNGSKMLQYIPSSAISIYNLFNVTKICKYTTNSGFLNDISETEMGMHSSLVFINPYIYLKLAFSHNRFIYAFLFTKQAKCLAAIMSWTIWKMYALHSRNPHFKRSNHNAKAT